MDVGQFSSIDDDWRRQEASVEGNKAVLADGDEPLELKHVFDGVQYVSALLLTSHLIHAALRLRSHRTWPIEAAHLIVLLVLEVLLLQLVVLLLLLLLMLWASHQTSWIAGRHWTE